MPLSPKEGGSNIDRNGGLGRSGREQELAKLAVFSEPPLLGTPL